MIAQSPVAAADTEQIRQQNSKLFDQYASSRTIEDYANDKSTNNADASIAIERSSKLHHNGKKILDSTRESYLRTAAVNADLIVVVEPTARHSDFTDGHRFIFSDYEASVDRVLFSRKVTVLPGQNIVVSRAGGILHQGNRKIYGHVTGFELFHLNEPYLLFLRYLPNGTFLVFGEAGYNISGSKVITHPEGPHKDTSVPRATFLEDVTHAIERLKEEGR